MTKRILTDEEKTLLAMAMEDVKPLGKKLRAPTTIKKSVKKLSTRHHSPPTLLTTLDLHGLTLEQAHSLLADFIEVHIRAKTREVLVITGKSGQLVQDVPRWLTLSDMKNHVSMVSKAKPRQGGEGALCVRLRKR